MIKNPILIINRGIPGSFKSTRAKTLAIELTKTNGRETIITSADQYMYENGEYVFSVQKLCKAHAQCREDADKAIREGKNIIVDNTHIKLKDYKWVHLLKRELALENIHFDIFTCTMPLISVEESFKRNVHGVPIETITRMRNEFQKDYLTLEWEYPNPKFKIL